MAAQRVQSRGIYHGLPVFPDSLKGLTAIITGANGISGYHMLQVLAQAPERWSKIYCLSRRPPAIPGGLPKQAEHIPLDFLKKPDEIAATLKENGVQAYEAPAFVFGYGYKPDYVFFYSYIQAEPKEGQGLWSDAEEMVRVNKLLLSNFLEGLEKASVTPKRFMLQTGAKHYGIHLGPAATPQKEHDPRVTIEPNFYYDQMDSLLDYCKRNSVGWIEARPSFILGAVPDAAMNLVFALGIYAAVQKQLNQPLDFPSGIEAWENHQDQSSAMLNGYLEEWAVLSENTSNQAFNCADGSSFSWGRLWPLLAEWYNMDYKTPEMDPQNYNEVEVGADPPPRGWGPKSKLRVRFTLQAWGKEPDVQAAWRELAEKHNLQNKEIPDPDRVLAFTDAALLGAAVDFSMDKARKMGFFGFVDSSECILEVLNDFAKHKLIPPLSDGVYKDYTEAEHASLWQEPKK